MNKLLFIDVAGLAEYVTFTGNISSFDSLKPAIRTAQGIVARYVGTQLIEQLTADSLSTNLTALKPYVQAPVANLVLLTLLDANTVQITDSGTHRTKSDTTADAFEWQMERTAGVLRRDAFQGIEDLLTYLDTHRADFPAYTYSVA